VYTGAADSYNWDTVNGRVDYSGNAFAMAGMLNTSRKITRGILIYLFFTDKMSRLAHGGQILVNSGTWDSMFMTITNDYGANSLF
jgi:hypothetical protein